jgi:hypothetical protein
MSEVHFEKFQKAGDIIFIQTRKRIPLNRFAQSLATAKRANYTHVLLCVMPGLYVHSVVKPGVHLVAAEDDEGNFPARYGKRWKVVRNIKVAKDPMLMGQVANKAIYYIGQKYNGAFAISSLLPWRFKASRSFCSELVARIYADLGHPINKLKPEQILPVHIDIAAQKSAEWQDVTSEYEEYLLGKVVRSEFEAVLDKAFPIPDMRPMFVQTVNHIVSGAITMDRMGKELRKLDNLTAGMPDLIQRMPEKEREKFAKEMNLDTRSFKSQLTPVIDGIFALDRGFLEKKHPPKPIVKQTWIQEVAEPLPEADLDEALAISLQFMATLRKSHRLLLESLLNASESIVVSLATVNMLPSLDPTEQLDLVKKQIEAMLSLIHKFLDFDNYESDLEDLNAMLKMRLASTSLGTEKAIGLFRQVAQQVQWRRQATKIKLVDRLRMFQSNPKDYDLAYALYADLQMIAPHTSEGDNIAET